MVLSERRLRARNQISAQSLGNGSGRRQAAREEPNQRAKPGKWFWRKASRARGTKLEREAQEMVPEESKPRARNQISARNQEIGSGMRGNEQQEPKV